MNNAIREQVLGVVSGLRGEKRAAKGGAAGKALKWVSEYLGRGKKLRGAIRGVEQANAELASKGQQLQELLGKRTADAALLRKYRPLASEVKRLAASGELVGHGKMSRLNDEYFRLANESRRGRPDALLGLGYPDLDPRNFEVAAGIAFPQYSLTSGDLASVKAFMAPHRSSKADKQAIKELKQYLGTHSARSTDGLRSELRKYYLTNAGVGAAGAIGLGGAGYGAYKALSGEKKAAEAYAAGFGKAAELAGFSPRGLARRMAIKEAAEKPETEGIRGLGNSILENAGRYTTVGETAALGSLLSKNKLKGTLGGAAAGILANLAGSGAALVTKSRSSGQQLDYDKTLKLRNLFVPALASFNKAKREERARLHKWY